MAGHAGNSPQLMITFSLCTCGKCDKCIANDRVISIQQKGDDIQIWNQSQFLAAQMINRIHLSLKAWKSFFEKEKEIKHLLENSLSNGRQRQRNVIIHLALKKVFSLKALALSAAVRHQMTQMNQRFFSSGLRRVRLQFHYLTEGTIQWFVKNDLDLLEEIVDIGFGSPVFALVATKENDYMLKVYAGLGLRTGYQGLEGICLKKQQIEKILTFKNIFFH